MMNLASKLSPSLTSMIRMDHTHVISTFHQYSPLKDRKTRQALANVLCRAISVHSMLEEEIFYPALLQVCPDEPVLKKSAPEHDEMRHLISVINATSSEHPEFDDNVMHHDSPDLFDPAPAIGALVARRNTVYARQHDSFYGGPVGAGWDLSENQVAPYQDPPAF